MAKMNLLAALQAALEATKDYVDDNHYNQTEVDALLDTKSDEGHTHNYLPLSGGTIESAEFAPLKIKNAGSDSLLLDTTTDDLGQSSNYFFQLPYTLDIKVGETYTLVSGDRTVTTVCKTGSDNDTVLEFWNAGSGIDVMVRANYNGSKGAYEKNTTYVAHMYNPVPDFKIYAPSTGDTTSGPAISFENGDDPLGHLCIEERNGSFLRYNSDASSSYTIIDEENYSNIINCESIGAAKADHGTHVTYATNAPKANGTAAVGSINRVAREDHIHPLQTSVSGNAGSANKVNQSLIIKLNSGETEGTDLFTFNGSAAKTIDLTPDSLGLSAAGHSHDDIYYTETEINTKLGEVQDNIQSAIDGYKGAIDGAKKELQTAINNEATSRSNADNALDARLDVLEGSGAGSVAKALSDAKSYADTKVAALVDSAPGTLDTLNELAAALGNDPNFATTIATQIGKKADKSHGNHVPTTQTANNAVFLRNDNTWATITPTNIGAAAAEHGTHVTYDDTNKPKAAGTAACGTSGKVARADHVHPLQTSVSGNAGSANKVNNALSIQLNGGTATTFDGSAVKSINITPASIGAAAAHSHDAYVNKNAFANIKVGETTVAADAVQDTVELVAGTNVTITPDATNDKITIAAKDTVYTHPNSGATAGSYGPSANATPGYGSTFNVPYLTVNAAGHVTAISTKTVKIPALNNTWRGVQDNLTSTAADQSLSANQGKVLKGLVDGKADMIEDTELTAMLTTVFGS